eukprot:Nitzschia sp. Nitz4//scaffold12_size214221//75891//77705//NITZ4_001495-RA/size214221-processed-gene-0.112-mRNA-1//1//CDS//3329535005//1127//frame0
MSLADGKSGFTENGSVSKSTEVVPAVFPKEENSTAEDEVIEIDYGMIDSAKAKRVRTLHLDERFLKTEITGKRTLRELKRILPDIQHLNDTMEKLHVELDQTPIQGSQLAMAITRNIRALYVKSGLRLHNHDDRQALGRVIYEHDSLEEICLYNLVVREGMVARWSKDPPPPLDILVPAFTSIVLLTVLEISREPEVLVAAAGTETQAPQKKPMFSLLGIKELSQSLTLRRLNLSNVGLTDEHFGVLVEQLSQGNSSSCLTELLLNENDNTDHGIDMISSLLFKEDCKLELVECYQTDNVVNNQTVELLIQALVQNSTLTSMRIHLWGEDENDRRSGGTMGNRLQFYLRLNRAGRKVLVSKSSTEDDWIDLLARVRGEPDLLFYCLRNSSLWWSMRNPASPRGIGPIITLKNSETPLSPLASPLGKNGATHDKGRLKELKAKHGDMITGLDLSSDGAEDGSDDSLKDWQKELKEKNLPNTISCGEDTEDDALQQSMVSLGVETYIQDLLNQKKDRARHLQEEIMEEALEELDFAQANNKLPPGMSAENFFTRVVQRLMKEKQKEEIAREEKIDSLLEKELLRVKSMQKEKSKQKDGSDNDLETQ